MTFPSKALTDHLAILGKWCPGWQTGRGHHADDLTARTGRVLCRDCSATVESLGRKEPA